MGGGWNSGGDGHSLLVAPEFDEERGIVEFDGVERDGLVLRNVAGELDVLGEADGEEAAGFLGDFKFTVDVASANSIESFTGLEISLGEGDGMSERLSEGGDGGFAIDNGFGRAQGSFNVAEVVGAIEKVVGAVAHFQVAEIGFDHFGVLSAGDDEDAAGEIAG